MENHKIIHQFDSIGEQNFDYGKLLEQAVFVGKSNDFESAKSHQQNFENLIKPRNSLI